MNAPINVQIIHHGNVPAFAVLPYEAYQAMVEVKPEQKRTTFPHEVVGMNVIEGMSLLKAWRRYFGLSQTELAQKAGGTQAQVANFENEKSIPRADTLLKLSNALGVSADLLLDMDD